MVSHGTMAIADFIAVAVTWRKTYATYRSLPQANMRVSLARVLLYDGMSFSLFHIRYGVLNDPRSVGTVYFLWVTSVPQDDPSY